MRSACSDWHIFGSCSYRSINIAQLQMPVAVLALDKVDVRRRTCWLCVALCCVHCKVCVPAADASSTKHQQINSVSSLGSAMGGLSLNAARQPSFEDGLDAMQVPLALV